MSDEQRFGNPAVMPPVEPREWFAENGIGIFPIKQGTKEPAVRHWQTDGAWHVSDVRPWPAYGVILGHIAVLDTDSEETETWAWDHAPETPFQVFTPRGVHRYYRIMRPVPKFVHSHGLTMEFRNFGQYVLGPDSLHPSGERYKPANWSWKLSDIPILPDNFQFDDRTGSTAGMGMHYGDWSPPEQVEAGERHDQMFRLARSLASHGVPEVEIERIVLEEDQRRCHPPIGPSLAAFVRRVVRHPDRQGWQRMPKRGWDLAAALIDMGLSTEQAARAAVAADPDWHPDDDDDPYIPDDADEGVTPSNEAVAGEVLDVVEADNTPNIVGEVEE